MTAAPPRVTVLLPAYNAASTVTAAVRSILQQTYSDFELLVLDDGSSDRTAEVVSALDDPRIRLVRNPRNLGLAETLNRGLAECLGAYVARMDADDESLPGRLAAQVRYLDARPEVAILGARIRAVTSSGSSVWKLPEDPAVIEAHLVFRNPIAHPTVMMRREVLDRKGLRYDGTLPLGLEDWDMWVRASRVTTIANMSDVLLLYTSRTAAERPARPPDATARDEAAARDVIRRALRGVVVPTETELTLHFALGSNAYQDMASSEVTAFLGRAEEWLLRLRRANHEARRFDLAAFDHVTSLFWYYACRSLAPMAGSPTLRAYARSPLRAGAAAPAERAAKIILTASAAGTRRSLSR